jgi:hypothetical protein
VTSRSTSGSAFSSTGSPPNSFRKAPEARW